MRDPYQVLGVTRAASGDDIKHAYRRLAKKYHPDLNPGRPEIEQRFKEISAAYTLLSDPQRRARYDRGEIDAGGTERPGGGAGYPGGAGAARPRPRPRRRTDDDLGGGFGSADDFLADLFGNRRRASAGGGAGASGTGGNGPGGSAGGEAGAGTRSRGGDIAYSVAVSFAEAALGAKRRIDLSNGKTLEVAIPAGVKDQQKLRLKGQGMATAAGVSGDAIVEIHVEPHPLFTRQGNDIHLEVPITLPEAVLGGVIRVPTLDGMVAVKVPPGSNTGTVLRLRGKGIPDSQTPTAGDEFVKLKVVLPDPPDPELAEFIERWSRTRSYDVRRKVGIE